MASKVASNQPKNVFSVLPRGPKSSQISYSVCDFYLMTDDMYDMYHTVQKSIVISNKFPRTFDSIFLSYVIDAY